MYQKSYLIFLIVKNGQLDTKAREMVNKCAKKIVKEIKSKFRTLERESKRNKHVKIVKVYNWIGQNRAIEMDQPVASPNIYEYE